MNIRIIITVFFISIVFSNCKTLKTSPLPELKLPEAYEGKYDSLQVLRPDRSDFFRDTLLLSLIDSALKNNPDMLIATERIEMARAVLRQSRAAVLPSVDAVVSAGVEKFGDYTLDGVGNYDTNLSGNIHGDRRIPDPTPNFFLGLRSSWELDLWKKLRHRKKAAVARFLGSNKGRQLVSTMLTAQVASAYYELTAFDNKLKVIRKNIELQEQALELSRVQKLGGRATELAVKQFEAQLYNTKSLEHTVIQQIAETENYLNFLLGRYPQEVKRYRLVSELKLPEKLFKGLPSQMLLNRPDIQQAELELVASESETRAARAAFFPSLVLTPFMGYNSFRAEVLFNPSSLAWGVVGGVTGPLFNRREIRSTYERVLAERKTAFYSYQKTVLDGFREVSSFLSGMDNFRKVYDQREREFQTLKEAVGISRDLYLAGRASYLEIITAQRDMLEAELQMIEARKSVFLTSVDLYRAVGGGLERN